MAEILTQTMKLSASRLISVNFLGQLDDGELLTGTPTFTEVTTSNLTLTNKVVSTSKLTINNTSVQIGAAAQCLVTSDSAATFDIIVTCGTDSTPAQTLVQNIELVVEADNA